MKKYQQEIKISVEDFPQILMLVNGKFISVLQEMFLFPSLNPKLSILGRLYQKVITSENSLLQKLNKIKMLIPKQNKDAYSKTKGKASHFRMDCEPEHRYET